MFVVRDLSVEVGGRLTTSGATFTLRAGDKVGLVGRNGAGKTSLLKVLAGEAPVAMFNITYSRRKPRHSASAHQAMQRTGSGTGSSRTASARENPAELRAAKSAKTRWSWRSS